MTYTQEMELLGQINMFELEDEVNEKEFLQNKPVEVKEYRIIRARREVVYIKR